jgi:aspartate aminotransferase
MTPASTRRQLEAPLEDFHELHNATLRRFGNRAVDLSFPNPKVLRDTRPHDALIQLAQRTGPDRLRYSPFGGFTTVRRQVAQQLGRQHQLAYEYHDILLTPGATAALTLIIGELLQPPDHAVVISPSWMDYPLYLHRRGVEYAMSPTTPDKRLDLPAIERMWTPRTRALIISNPACPTGVCYSDSEIRALADLLRTLGTPTGPPPLLINDETHRDQVWAGTMTSAAQHYPHTVTVYSYGKAWQMQGERIGYAAVHPDHPIRESVRTRLAAGMRSTGLCAPAATSQHLVAALADYIPPLGGLAELQRHARRRLRQAEYVVIDAEATPFVYVGAPSGDGFADARRAARGGVLVMPSELFHEQGFLRLALNTDGVPLDYALDVLTELNRNRGTHA